MLSVPYYLFAMFGPGAGASPEDQKRSTMTTIVMTVFMVVIFYVMLIRPQQTQAKKQKALIAGLKKNDKVITSSGIIGIVTSVAEESVTIRSADTKLEIQKSAITSVTAAGSES